MKTEYMIIAAVLIFLFAFFLGWIFGKKSEKRSPDGVLIIEKHEDRDAFRWVFNEELEEFKHKSELYIKVQHSQNSQLV